MIYYIQQCSDTAVNANVPWRLCPPSLAEVYVRCGIIDAAPSANKQQSTKHKAHNKSTRSATRVSMYTTSETCGKGLASTVSVTAALQAVSTVNNTPGNE